MSEYSLKVTLPPFRNKFYKDGKPYLNNFVIKTGTNEDYEIVNEEEMDNLRYSKNQIDNVCNNKDWDTSKKITNPYELIYISSRKSKLKSVASYDPLSRSYFKLWEILHDYFLNSQYPKNRALIMNQNKIRVAHIAEGPGGFMEAIINFRKKYINNFRRSSMDDIFGITLRSTDKEIPGWKKANMFLKNNPNIVITYGSDGTGNIYNIENLIYFRNRVGYNSVDFITADGGFDFSIDFNSQEFLAQRLIFCEIVSAISVQKVGGCFVCKFFDTYSILSIRFIYILQCLYENVHIVKPLTSRPANSEKYIVACQFKGIDHNTLTEFYGIVKQWGNISNANLNIIDIYDFKMDLNFLRSIWDYNSSSMNAQVEYINKTLDHIRNKKSVNISRVIKQQKKNAEAWCLKYNVL